MKYLFLDSTYDLSLGLLDSRWNWLAFDSYSGQKASAIIQLKSYKMMLDHNVRPIDLAGVITVNGPGFYTGLRLAEGFSDVFNFFGVKQFSLYSYQIPNWCGYQAGSWFTKAYRGEYFIYRWNKNKVTKDLISVKDLDKKLLSTESYFIHSESSLDKWSSPIIKNPISTLDLIKKYPAQIMSEAMNSEKKELFYFRAPEDEFKVNP